MSTERRWLWVGIGFSGSWLSYVAWCRSSRGYMHMKIVCCDGKYILGQFSQPFDSVPLMIHHYSLNKLPIKGAEHISLTQPIVNDML